MTISSVIGSYKQVLCSGAANLERTEPLIERMLPLLGRIELALLLTHLGKGH